MPGLSWDWWAADLPPPSVVHLPFHVQELSPPQYCLLSQDRWNAAYLKQVFACWVRPYIFLLVDLRGEKSDLGSGGTKKIKQKSSENDQLTGHFQSLFFLFIFFFLISLEKNSKSSIKGIPTVCIKSLNILSFS